ncbi:hypothetical protein ncot_00540 [Nocardioides sp. JQ2195]|uniref:hypothetical protein n=1 Tax=Nocardioides sp. JQ2195 TaxID=2592334 RepID=UPI00143E9E82|nr:hypothetical protein [Nocardioides sp. JQ2195]QIX25239.1 hypothetical protein ncot_00540 [Nocardioides sp. JQ2195]
MRRLALVGASLALLGGLTACGGAPDDASKDDFCDAAKKIDASSFDDAKDAVEDLNDVGTPEDISDDARDGFEFFVDEVGDADSEDDLPKDEDLSDDEKKQSEAFFKYITETCS